MNGIIPGIIDQPPATSRRTLDSYADSYLRNLRARNVSPMTLSSYEQSLRSLSRFLTDRGMPLDPSAIRREHIESYVIDQQETRSAGTAQTRFDHLRTFWRWLKDEEEIPDSPMRNMKRPQSTPPPAMVLSDTQGTRLLATCKGTSWYDRRDRAIIRIMLDTGLRRQELLALDVDDVQWGERGSREPQAGPLLHVRRAKGGAIRHVPIGTKAAVELDRYLRVRDEYAKPDATALFIGSRIGGRLSFSQLQRIVVERGQAAGIIGLHPHVLRHTWSHNWRKRGGGDADLMTLAGWKSTAMLRRYAMSGAEERAILAHVRVSPGDHY